MKKIISLILSLTLSLGHLSLYAYTEVQPLSPPPLDFTSLIQGGSDALFKAAQVLVSEYPDYLTLKTIGLSHDEKPIFVLILTSHVQDFLDQPQHFYTGKKHYLFEAGMHARETTNPVVMLKTIAWYLQDLEAPDTMPEVDMPTLLSQSVLHFIPLSNPDGYDLAKFGASGLQSQAAKDLLLRWDWSGEKDLKSNARGVDINRNFPDHYYDISSGVWRDIWKTKQNNFQSYEPSDAYYHGDRPGSEPETQALMAYALSQDFRHVISYHSRGEVIYWHQWMHPTYTQDINQPFAQFVSQHTGYPLSDASEYASSSGYFSDYFVNNTQKPFVTIETLPSRTPLPTTDLKLFIAVFEDTKRLPLASVIRDLYRPYGTYRLYVKGTYVRDYTSLAYAKAVAKQLGGEVVTGNGTPTMTNRPVVSRLHFLIGLLNRLDQTWMTTTGPGMADSDHPALVYALSKGWVKGDPKGLFYPTHPISPYEVALLLARVDTTEQGGDVLTSTTLYQVIPTWAYKEVQYVLARGYLEPLDFIKRSLTEDDILKILVRFQNRQTTK